MNTRLAAAIAGVVAVGILATAVVIMRQPPLTAAERASADPQPANAPNQRPAFAAQTDAPLRRSGVAFDVVTIARGLEEPWGLAFLPDGRMLVTEIPRRLLIVWPDGGKSAPVSGLPDNIAVGGQGGLLDVALDPDFASTRRIYWSFSERRPDGTNNTAVACGTFVDAAPPRVEDIEIIYHQTPSLKSTGHFGGRLVFGRDGTLFLTQGERVIPEGRMQAQRLDGLLGKIRNIEAATLHPATGELWEVEHGTRGGDEVNIARKGRDNGWPRIKSASRPPSGASSSEVMLTSGETKRR